MSDKDVNITIRHTQKRVPISDFSKLDTKSKEGLNKLRVVDLRALIVKHNLHIMIRKYSSMKKTQLIDVLVKYTPQTSIKIKKKKHDEQVPEPVPSPPPSPVKSHVKLQ